MNTVIARREIGCGDAIGHLSIETPQPDQDDWRCEYELDWPGVQRRSHAMGIDSYQALQLAMLKAVIDIAASEDFKAGRLFGFDQPIRTIDELKQFFGVSRLPGFDA